MVIFIKESILKASLTAMETTIGKMAAILKEASKTGYDRGMGCGKRGRGQAINMKENT